MDKRNKKIFKLIEEYIAISLGLILYGLAWVVFLWPHNLLGGGVSGIATLINYATCNANGTGGIPTSATYFVINVILLIVGFKILGKGFGAKTIYAIGLTTLLFEFLPLIVPQEIISSLASNNDLICAIMGGIFAGVGIGVSFNNGGSSGGTDIVALIINKYRSISLGRVILYIDLIIIGCSFFVFQDITKILYGYIMIAVTGYTIDFTVSGAKQSLQILVFSKNYEQIANRITHELGRGVTVIDSMGWFTKESGKVLIVVVRKYEANEIYRVIREEDSKAFLSVSNAMGVFGQGFEIMKVKAKNKILK